MPNALLDDAAILSQRPDASVLVMGGDVSDPNSMRLQEKIQAAVDATGLPKSEICGRKGDDPAHSDVDEDDYEPKAVMKSMFDAADRTNHVVVDGFETITSLRRLGIQIRQGPVFFARFR